MDKFIVYHVDARGAKYFRAWNEEWNAHQWQPFISKAERVLPDEALEIVRRGLSDLSAGESIGVICG